MVARGSWNWFKGGNNNIAQRIIREKFLLILMQSREYPQAFRWHLFLYKGQDIPWLGAHLYFG